MWQRYSGKITLMYLTVPLLFSPPGITEWETILPSFHLSSDGTVRCANADRLEPVPLPHLPLQNLFCPQPALPLLPVSIHRKSKEGRLHSSHTHRCLVWAAVVAQARLPECPPHFHDPFLQLLSPLTK